MRFSILFLLLLPGVLKAQQGYFFRPNPLPSHYFLVPTGFEQDEARHRKALFRNGCLLLQQLYYEYPRGFYAGLGFIPTFVLGGENNFIPTWILAGKRWKTRNPRQRIQFDALLLDQPNNEEICIFNLSLAHGNKDKNLSLGVGFGTGKRYVWEEDIYKTWMLPGLTLRGLVRLTRSHWLIGEHYLLHSNDGWLPINLNGFRWNKGRFSIDLALFSGLLPASNGRRTVAGPWMGMQFVFEKRYRVGR